MGYRCHGCRERVSYLNPQPVPPSTMAATRTAPAMEPMMMLVPLGPGGGQGWIGDSDSWDTAGGHSHLVRCLASPLYRSVSPVGGGVGRGLWTLQSLPVQSGWQMHFPSLLQTWRAEKKAIGKGGP